MWLINKTPLIPRSRTPLSFFSSFDNLKAAMKRNDDDDASINRALWKGSEAAAGNENEIPSGRMEGWRVFARDDHRRSIVAASFVMKWASSFLWSIF